MGGQIVRTAKRYSTKSDFAIVAFVFVLAVALSHPFNVVLLKSPPRFLDWSDQKFYFRSAAAFFGGDQRPEAHMYPLLYSLMLAPFSRVPPLLATTLVDLACFVAAFGGYRSVFRRLGQGRELPRAALIITFLVGTVLYPVTGDGWIMPWTTTPSAALIWGALAGCAGLIDPTNASNSPPRGWSQLPLFGVILGLIPLCRPADVAVACAIFGFAATALLARRRWADMAVITLAGLCTVAAGGALHLAIYGPHPSHYMLLSATYGANFAWLGWKAYVILIDPRPWYPYGYGLLKLMPWLPVGAAGMIVALRAPTMRLTLLMFVSALISASITLAYIDLLPSGMWKYGNAHYFKWIIPMLAGYAWLFLRDCRKQMPLSLGALAVVIIPACVRMVPVLAPADQAARMVVFDHVPSPFENVYFSHGVMQDRRGLQLSPFGFRVVPDDAVTGGNGLVFAESLRRDFAGDERWIYPPRGIDWPGPDKLEPALVMAGPFPKQPIARYRPVLALGWPCWLAPYRCPVTLPR